MKGRLVTLALIDCHTHLIFAGSRAEGVRAAPAGASPCEIARQVASSPAVRDHPRGQRISSMSWRCRGSSPLIRGRGHYRGDKVRLWPHPGGQAQDAAGRPPTGRHCPSGSRQPLLAAHAVPPGVPATILTGRDHLPGDHPGSRRGGSGRMRWMSSASTSASLLPRPGAGSIWLRINTISGEGHMDQLSNPGGSTLAANFGALSVDHLEYLDQDGIQALAHRGVVATLLPPPSGFLKGRPSCRWSPPCARRGVPMAVSSDINPGTPPSSPCGWP